MRTITRVSRAMQAVLVDKANELAFETGFMERERVLTGTSFVVGLMSGWQANPQSSLEGLSQAIGNAGTPISRQGVANRFDQKAARFLKTVLGASLEETVKAMPISTGILSRFESVDLVDSSIFILPNDLEAEYQGSGTVSSDVFASPSGLVDGNAYGMLFNGDGASVDHCTSTVPGNLP